MHSMSVLSITPLGTLPLASSGRLKVKTVVPAGAGNRSSAPFGLPDALASRLAGISVHKDGGRLVADAGGVTPGGVQAHLDGLKLSHAIDHPGWHEGAGAVLAAESLAATLVCQPMLEHGRYDAIHVSGAHLMGAGVQLSRDCGIPLVAGVSWPAYPPEAHAGINSRLSKALSHCSGIIADDASMLGPLSRLGAAVSNRRISSDLANAHELAVLVRESRILAAFARDSGRPHAERRQAAGHGSAIASRLGPANAHSLRSGAVAAIAAPLEFSFDYSPAAAASRASALRSIASQELGAGPKVGVIAGTLDGLLAFSRAFSLLHASERAIAFVPPWLESPAARALAGTGLSSRMAFASQGDAGLMSACRTLVCPDGLAVPRKSIAAATHAACGAGGPTVLFGPVAPAIYAASETNFGSSPSADAMLISTAGSDASLRRRFHDAAVAAASESWSPARHAMAVEEYFLGLAQGI